MPASTSKNIAANSLAGIWTVLLSAFVIAFLYFGREVLIPMALAILLTFLLSPLVTRLERWAGRIGAVLLVVTLVLAAVAGTGWLLTRQVIDLAGKLPDYQANIESKMRSVRMPEGSTLNRLSHLIEHLKKALPVSTETLPEPGQSAAQVVSTPPAISVRVVEAASAGPVELIKTLVAPLLAPLGMMALVLLLLIFMLLKREDLRSRIIRLIGQGRISATTHAMDDAGRRVARYLLMQLIVNASYGGLVALGLYFIGLPNVLLWGILAAILRFIPYIGPWLGAAFPLILSLAISTSWSMPLLTFSLFAVLELINANAVEPWLYGATTGISSVALIVAAVFWTWLWGPVGLVLSTPLTVCLVVMGLHVPKLEFLSVLLSDERALAPHEEFYHRLIALDPNEVSQFSDSYLKANSLTVVYDTAVIPALIATEMDYRAESLDADQRATILRDIRDIIEDLGQRPAVDPALEPDSEEPVIAAPSTAAAAADCRILCLPVRAERDEIAGTMLAQLLLKKGFHIENASSKLMSGELLELVEQSQADTVCLSVVAPSSIIHARYLISKLRARFPQLKILAGLWFTTEDHVEAAVRLKASGADSMATSLAEAIVELGKLSIPFSELMIPAPIPADDDKRLEELSRLNLIDSEPEAAFDRVTKKMARAFDVPIALISLVDQNRQFFKSQIGLPKDLAEARGTPRSQSICGHLIASNSALVVEDLACDKRFANNPFVKEHNLRFYAGAPLHGPTGQTIGSVCILDTKPRQMTEREKRHLMIVAEEVTEQIAAHAPTETPVKIPAVENL